MSVCVSNGEKGGENIDRGHSVPLRVFLPSRVVGTQSSRYTPRQSGFNRTCSPGPINGMRNCRVRLCDVADGKIWLFAARGLAKRKPTVNSKSVAPAGLCGSVGAYAVSCMVHVIGTQSSRHTSRQERFNRTIQTWAVGV